MAAKFVLRLDDACPTMPDRPWRMIEDVCAAHGLRPIVGVIPDCQDPTMRHTAPDPQFWDRVRRWRDLGWTIALHGLHHVYHPDPPGARALVPFHRRGEFVGLSLDRQRGMIGRAWKIFSEQDLAPTYFMAPSHSFDTVTLEALRAETGIGWITDGISFRAFGRQGFRWLPQQVWWFRRVPFGLWTVCLHPSTMSQPELERLVADIARFKDQVTSAPEEDGDCPPYGLADMAFASFYWNTQRLKGVAAKLIRR